MRCAGAIREKWASIGWEDSILGFPTSDEYAADSGRRTDFQNGYITWSPATGAVVHSTGSGVPDATTTARGLLDALPIAVEDRTGYDRSLFRHWIDADRDGCDTRAEVLIEESRTPVTTDPSCLVLEGEWFSYYDGGPTWTSASDVDIDHVVALAEAWDSGAKGWSALERELFANDLDYPWSLEAVTDNVNASKSDSDPAQWLPPLASVRCEYAIRWVAVKYRWRLSIDDVERNALSALMDDGCGGNDVPTPARAR